MQNYFISIGLLGIFLLNFISLFHSNELETKKKNIKLHTTRRTHVEWVAIQAILFIKAQITILTNVSQAHWKKNYSL